MTEEKFPIKKAAVSIGAALLAIAIGGYVYKTANPDVDVRLIIIVGILSLILFIYVISIVIGRR